MKRSYGVMRDAQAIAQTAERAVLPAAGLTPDTSGNDAQAGERGRETRGNFDARAIREMLTTAGADPKAMRRTKLGQIMPLPDSTIYEIERRGEFPQRFLLTPRCVVRNLAEVMA